MIYNITGVRYQQIDSGKRILQVRLADCPKIAWWSVRDAIERGLIPSWYSPYKRQYSELEAKIARVRLMECVGLVIPDGVLLAYADATRTQRLKTDGAEKRPIPSEKKGLGTPQSTHGRNRRKRHVMTDEELRKYKPGIFGVFKPQPVNKQAAKAVHAPFARGNCKNHQ